MREVKETHANGTISLENVNLVKFGIDHVDHPYITGDFGIQIARDGRVWVCIDGVAFMRFSPHPNGKMMR